MREIEKPTEEDFEITPEMIAAGSQVLMEDQYLSELMCEAYAEDYAEKIIRRALSARRPETF